jgi:hypothetical protein
MSALQKEYGRSLKNLLPTACYKILQWTFLRMRTQSRPSITYSGSLRADKWSCERLQKALTDTT